MPHSRQATSDPGDETESVQCARLLSAAAASKAELCPHGGHREPSTRLVSAECAARRLLRSGRSLSVRSTERSTKQRRKGFAVI